MSRHKNRIDQLEPGDVFYVDRPFTYVDNKLLRSTDINELNMFISITLPDSFDPVNETMNFLILHCSKVLKVVGCIDRKILLMPMEEK